MSWLRYVPTLAFPALVMASPAGAAPGDHPAPGAFAPLFHGNWCGAGDANRAPPVDALDAACRAHDLCYERVGRGACSCDRAFLQVTAALVKSRRVEETVRNKAATANSLFSATLCTETQKNPLSAGKR